QETPAFRQIQHKAEIVRTPIVEILRHHRKALLIAIGLKVSEIAVALITSVFVISYATATLHMPRADVLNSVLVAAVVALFSIPCFGWLSDRVGRKRMFYASCIFTMLFAFPLFWLIQTRNPAIVIVAIVITTTFGKDVMFGVGAPWYSELFPANTRYSGASLGFQVGAALSGGLTPVIATALVAWSGGATWAVSLYLILCAGITLTAAIAAPETAQKAII
ncbi:MAG TPA: MFS transporter, partial [Bradyrhizobium sp.]|nr:MFS transporter [Bradyrhizobium sp.]